MSGLYTAAQIAAGFLGFIAIGGVVWFASSLSNAIVLAGVLLGLTSLAAAFVPQRKLSNDTIRRSLVALCTVGIVAGSVLVTDNLKASHGIEWDVVSMNLLNIAALATMAINAVRHNPKM
jgi:hypothetical protein